MNFYTQIVRPLLFAFPPEKAHHITFSLLKLFRPLLRPFFGIKDSKSKSVRLMGLEFPHPVGLAAGLDKDGKAYKSFFDLGFSFVELGTVTPKAQPGNQKPRLFRLPKDLALINRMGFNNDGADQLAARLKGRQPNLIIGGNIGKNTDTPNKDAVADYLYCFKALYESVDYFVVNVSCPNIQDLRELQDKDSLEAILKALTEFRSSQLIGRPILLKVSPDLNTAQLDDLISVVKQSGIDGLVATNTTITRNDLVTQDAIIEQIGRGGLSGAPLKKRSNEVISHLRKELGPEFPIIASGGIMTEDDAVEKIKAGADLIQLYTGFIYEGPGLIRKILKKLY